jgi:hypothetical protein
VVITDTFIIGCTMLATNFAFEYATLTKRHGVFTHIAVRLATVAIYVLGRYLAKLDLVSYGEPLSYGLAFLFFFDCVYLFEESLSQKLFLFFMNWGIARFLSSLCVWLTSWLGLGGAGFPFSSLFFIGSYLLLAPLYVRYWRKPIKESLHLFGYGKPIYSVFPLLSFLLLIMLLGPSVKTPDLRSLALMVLFETLVILSYYLLFAHARVVYGHLQSEADLKASKRQILLQKKYYEEMERGVYAQRKLLHDNRHHLMALSSLASAGDYGALDKYLKTLLENDGGVSPRSYCENGIANAIIGGYIEMAVSKGINVAVDLDLPERMGIDGYDLCVFFGNTIENAIEACERIAPDKEPSGDRHIEIRSRIEGDCLLARIENSFQPDEGTAKDAFPSSKGELGGIGLQSVRAIVEKYRGCMSCERKGRLFILSALLYPRHPA